MKNSPVLDTVKLFSKQIEQTISDLKDFSLSEKYQDINKILFCGMGGSGLGARIIENLYKDTIKYPVIRHHDYGLPKWCDEKTLIFCISYSGNTEETVSNLEEAIKIKAKIVVISCGGKLKDIAKQNDIPFYEINQVNNPSQMPRLGLGYTFISELIILQKLNILEAIPIASFLPEKIEIVAKKTASYLKHRSVVLVSAEHMVGSTHAFKNMLNENAKTFSSIFSIPEMNHHFLEGLAHPSTLKKEIVILFIESENYSSNITKRINITKDIVTKHKIPVITWKSNNKNKLDENIELLSFAGFCSYYLAIFYKIDPAPIPWVDYFKENMLY